jgi:anti-sigma regulatory factor (Ser/Thr protein kinase)
MVGRADRCSIDVPGDPLYLSTVRLFASAVARHFGAPEETVGDLKVAVSEACSAFVRGADGDGSVRVTIEATPDLHVEVLSEDLSLAVPAGRAGAADTPTPGSAATELGLALIRSLFEDAEVRSDGVAGISFRVPIAAERPV